MLPLRKLTTNIDAFRKEKSLEVIISFIVNPDEIYVQQVSLLHHISQLSENMAKYYMDKGVAPGQNNSNIYAPSKGKRFLPDRIMIIINYLHLKFQIWQWLFKQQTSTQVSGFVEL